MAEADNVSIAIVGSGGAGALTTGNLLLEAAAAAGWYGLLNRTVGPQIRGGEAAALIRLAAHPIECLSDQFDLLIAVDWLNADRFDAEIPLGPHSLVVGDPRGGDVPANITVSGARLMEIPFKDLAKAIPEGRANMIALGVAAKLLGLGEEALSALIEKRLKEKGASAIAASRTAIKAGISAAADIDLGMRLAMPKADTRKRWLVSGNEATGLGAIRGGVRFTAAYPITPNGRPTLPRPCRARPSCFPTNSWDKRWSRSGARPTSHSSVSASRRPKLSARTNATPWPQTACRPWRSPARPAANTRRTGLPIPNAAFRAAGRKTTVPSSTSGATSSIASTMATIGRQ